MKKIEISKIMLFLFSFVFLWAGCSSETQVLQVGKKPPDFTLPEVDSKNEITLSHLKDHVVLIRFWTVECTSCAKEMPELEKIYQSSKERGMSILAVNVRQPEDVVKKFLSNLPVPITYSVLLDTYAKTYKHYGIVGVPTTVIVDRKGVIREKIIGEIDKETLEHLVVNLL